MSAPPASPRRLNLVVIMAISLLAGGLLGAASAFLDTWDSPLAQPLIFAAIAVAMIFALIVCLAWWRGADEAVREAHKWAWFWGGSCGLAIGAGLMLVAQMMPEQMAAIEAMTGLNAFVTGISVVLSLEVAGYLIAWAWWWLSKR